MTGTWPTKTLRIYWGLECAGVDSNRLLGIYQSALGAIQDVCDVDFVLLGTADGANLVVTAVPIDGPEKEVALTQEPTPGITPATQLWQHFDSADLPGLSDGALFVLFLHEVGHFLGREHSADGILSVMSAYLNESLSGLTAYDVSELQAMYGPPSAAPAPAPLDSATVEFTVDAPGTYILTLSLARKA